MRVEQRTDSRMSCLTTLNGSCASVAAAAQESGRSLEVRSRAQKRVSTLFRRNCCKGVDEDPVAPAVSNVGCTAASNEIQHTSRMESQGYEYLRAGFARHQFVLHASCMHGSHQDGSSDEEAGPPRHRHAEPIQRCHRALTCAEAERSGDVPALARRLNHLHATRSSEPGCGGGH